MKVPTSKEVGTFPNSHMIYLLPPVMFLSFGWLFTDSTSLLSSSLAVVLVLLDAIRSKIWPWIYGQKLLFGIVTLFIISTVINGNHVLNSMIGSYQRNFGILYWLSIFLIFSLTIASSSNASRRFLSSLKITLLLAIFYGLVQYLGLDPINWAAEGYIGLTLGNENFASAMLGILSIVLFSSLVNTFGLYKKTTIFGLLSLVYVIMFQVGSLQGFIISIIGFLVYVNIRFSNDYRFSHFGKQSYLRLRKIAILILGIFFLLLNFSETTREWIVEEGNVRPRISYWGIGIQIFKDNVLIGVGPDQFQVFAALYRSPEIVMRDGAFVIPDSSHNVLIDILSTGGIFTGFLWLMFILYIFYVLKKTSDLNLRNTEREELAIYGAIWTAFFIQSMISPTHVTISVIGYIASGFIVKLYCKNLSLDHIPQNMGNNSYLRGLFVGLLIFATFVYGKVFIGEYVSLKSLKILKNKESIELLELESFTLSKPTEKIMVEVSKLDPSCDFTKDVAKKVVELDNKNSLAWFFISSCSFLSNNFEESLEAVDMAIKYDPLNPTYREAKVEIAIKLGKRDIASATLNSLKEIYPDNPQITRLEALISVMP